jgi:hypothetical protein
VNLELIHEPELEFAEGGRHLDPRFGVLRYGPLDASGSAEMRGIEVGMIGTSETILALRSWLERCRDPIAGKQTHLRNLFPDFPGFAGDTMFQAELLFDDDLDRSIGIRDLRGCVRRSADATRRKVCDLLIQELAVLLEDRRPRIVLVALPLEILERVEPAAASDAPSKPASRRKRRPFRLIFTTS